MATSPHSQLDVGVDGHEREQQVRRQLLIPQDLFKPTTPSHAQMKGRTTQNSSRRKSETMKMPTYVMNSSSSEMCSNVSYEAVPSQSINQGRQTLDNASPYSSRNGMTIFTQNLHNPPYPHTIARQSTRAPGPIEEEHHRT